METLGAWNTVLSGAHKEAVHIMGLVLCAAIEADLSVS